MLDLLVVRHGETDWNREHRWQGQTDVPLNATGQAQAQALARALRDEPAPDDFISSDLQRALATAAPLAQAWGMGLQRDARWREQHFGLWEGLDWPTIRREHAALWPAWAEHAADFALPGGESMRQIHARVMAAVRTLGERHAGQRVAVLTHGGVLDMLWREANGLPLDGLREALIPNTGINRLRWHPDSGRLEILQWADAEHLADAAELAPLPTPSGAR
jgi:2,3-bisphosphoglycerate-dependent phosphoglycerate mutase